MRETVWNYEVTPLVHKITQGEGKHPITQEERKNPTTQGEGKHPKTKGDFMNEIVNDSVDTSAQNEQIGSNDGMAASEKSDAQADFSDSGTDSEERAAARTEGRSNENARRRKEAEARQRQRYEADLAKERNSAREAAILEVLNRKNPYTGEEMKDSRDIEEYFAMKEIEENGGDPVGDFAKHYKERERQKEAKAAEAVEQKRWYENDRRAFEEKFPNVELQKLIEDPDFVDYADGKVGKRSLSAIYEGYLDLVKKSETRAKEMAAQMLANRKATPGSLAGNDSSEGYFSREDVAKMKPAEVKRNYDVIRKSMERWK